MSIELDPERAREIARETAEKVRPLRVGADLKKMAKDFAREWHDESATFDDKSNVGQQTRSMYFRAVWPDCELYVEICWPMFVKAAREQCLKMLQPNSGVSDATREMAYDAIVQDHNANQGRPTWPAALKN